MGEGNPSERDLTLRQRGTEKRRTPGARGFHAEARSCREESVNIGLRRASESLLRATETLGKAVETSSSVSET